MGTMNTNSANDNANANINNANATVNATSANASYIEPHEIKLLHLMQKRRKNLSQMSTEDRSGKYKKALSRLMQEIAKEANLTISEYVFRRLRILKVDAEELNPKIIEDWNALRARETDVGTFREISKRLKEHCEPDCAESEEAAIEYLIAESDRIGEMLECMPAYSAYFQSHCVRDDSGVIRNKLIGAYWTDTERFWHVEIPDENGEVQIGFLPSRPAPACAKVQRLA